MPCLDSRLLIRRSRARAWRERRRVRAVAASWRRRERDWVEVARAVTWDAVEAGRDGMVRWMKEGFVAWFRVRAREVAVETRVEEMGGEREGRRVGRVVKGGEERRREVDSGERWEEGVERRGGRRRRRSRRSGGRVGGVDGGGCGRPRGRRRVGLGVLSDGVAVEMAEIRRWCFIVFIRCFLRS